MAQSVAGRKGWRCEIHQTAGGICEVPKAKILNLHAGVVVKKIIGLRAILKVN